MRNAKSSERNITAAGRMKLFGKSIGYSFSLLYRSSGLLILPHLALELLEAVFPLLTAFALKYLLDVLIGEAEDMPAAMLCVGLYVAVLVLQTAIKSVAELISNSLYEKAANLYDCEVAEKLAALPLSVLDTSEGRDMVDDVRYTKNTAVYLAVYRVPGIISLFYAFCAAFGTLAAFHAGFSILFLILTIPGILLDMVFEQKAEDLRLRTAPDVRRFCYYRWMLTDPWPAKDVRMYNLTDPIRERYDSEKDVYRRANKKLDQKKLSAALLAEGILRSGEIAFTVFVIVQALESRISIGDVALYTGLALSAATAFQRMALILVLGYTRTTKSMGRLLEFLAIPCPESSAVSCPESLESLCPKLCADAGTANRTLSSFESLVFDNVYFKYPMTDKYVLAGASFTLNRGDRLSIVGINGSGKSTIIKLMLGLYEIESGQILLNGFPLQDYDLRDVRRQFSVLFQSFVQYPLTLRDNIALSDYDGAQDEERILQALEQSGISEELDAKLDKGLDSYLTRRFDDKGVELSKGQWQKIALARAYFKGAPVVIFDEPSAALDAEAEDRIFRNFEKMSSDRTGIMISHRISAARMSNKIIVLADGKIAESGTHEELEGNGGMYAKLYHMQKEKYVGKEAEER